VVFIFLSPIRYYRHLFVRKTLYFFIQALFRKICCHKAFLQLFVYQIIVGPVLLFYYTRRLVSGHFLILQLNSVKTFVLTILYNLLSYFARKISTKLKNSQNTPNSMRHNNLTSHIHAQPIELQV